MLNSLTLRESAQQIGINLKAEFRMTSLFFSTVTSNINILSGIVEVNEMFFHELFKRNHYIPHSKDRKCCGVRDKKKK